MRIGVVLPQTEIGADRDDLRRYAVTVEGLGYRHLLAYDHVLGADPEVHAPWAGAYTVDTTFHEPFVLFPYLAAFCSIELVTGVIILPQRQTALVAKQVAEVDLLTGGQFRFGVGLGWNAVEYEALGKDFTNRGARFAEQIELIRLLTSERSVTFEGTYEQVRGAGVAPLGIQRPIPIWIGAQSEAALRRAGRLGDGWFPQRQPGDGLEEIKAIVDEAAREAGRDPSSLGMEGRITLDPANPGSIVETVAAWERTGATHLSISTMSLRFPDLDAHLDALSEAARLLDLHP